MEMSTRRALSPLYFSHNPSTFFRFYFAVNQLFTLIPCEIHGQIVTTEDKPA